MALETVPAAGSGPEALERLAREAKTLAAIDHPAVATVYALERGPDGPVIVMEYVAGDSLARRLASGPLGLREGVKVLRAVASALGAVHARGIVHLDLKPSNVMLLPDRRVKVLDFGLAHAGAGDETGEAGAGTMGYMSPEQLRGDPLDPRTDIFAMGAIGWECLTGEPVFPGPTPAARVAATLTDRVDPAACPARCPGPCASSS